MKKVYAKLFHWEVLNTLANGTEVLVINKRNMSVSFATDMFVGDLVSLINQAKTDETHSIDFEAVIISEEEQSNG